MYQSTAHCPKSNLNLSIKSGAIVTAGADAIYGIQYAWIPNVFHCMCYNRDRLGFNAGAHIIFGIVYRSVPASRKSDSVADTRIYEHSNKSPILYV